MASSTDDRQHLLGRKVIMDFEELLDEILPDGWTHDADIYGMECSLYCPHGEACEQDGTTSCGCVSPLRSMGII